uniref:Peptidase_M13 domain-containing protein n=1 Tax=Strongyloides papillosus TaxID=174720 RepID=A0A0N5B6W1_STREA
MKFETNFDKYDLSNVGKMEECYKKVEPLLYNSNILGVIEDLRYYKEKNVRNHTEDDLSSCNDKIFYPQEILDPYLGIKGWYDSKENTFYINSDAIKEPSFSKDYPTPLNFGGVGYTIAYEIVHAFDNKNYKLKLRGDYENKYNVTDWSIKNFQNRSDCFVEKYGMQNESITNKNINGTLTLNENIADNGGLKLAHRAYMKYLKEIGGKDIEVPAYNQYTDEQLFFISAGRKHCTYKSKDKLENQKKTDKHPPGEIRTNMALSYYKPFYDAFKCSYNRKMNLKGKDKCELWKNH